jgi:quercetin dioxygenase-like cupin family protein
VTVSVIDLASGASSREGDAEVTLFLGSEVGARTIEGMAYSLAPGGALGPLEAPGRHQLFYVTAGRLTADFQGQHHDLATGQGVYCEPGESCRFENRSDALAAFYRFVIEAPRPAPD